MSFHIYPSSILSGAGISSSLIALIVFLPSKIALHNLWYPSAICPTSSSIIKNTFALKDKTMKLAALKRFNSQVYIPQWHITYRVFLCFREIIKCLGFPYFISSKVFTFGKGHIIYWYFHVIPHFQINRSFLIVLLVNPSHLLYVSDPKLPPHY